MILFIVAATFISKDITANVVKFQDGLLHFFRYLNKETSSIPTLDDSNQDEIGTMAKVVNENIIKAKNLIEQDETVISDVKRVVNLVKDSYIKQSITASTSNKGLEELKILFNEMLEVISSNVAADINKVQVILKQFHSLDFSHRVPNASGKISIALNSLADIINKMLVENKSNGMTLQNSANILLDNVSTLSSSSNQAIIPLSPTRNFRYFVLLHQKKYQQYRYFF